MFQSEMNFENEIITLNAIYATITKHIRNQSYDRENLTETRWRSSISELSFKIFRIIHNDSVHSPFADVPWTHER